MSFSDTIFLFFLALVLFGPKKLPEMARQAGRLLAELRRASNEFRSQIETEIAHLEVEKSKTVPAATPPHGTVASLSLNPASSQLASHDSEGTLAGPAEIAPQVLTSPDGDQAKPAVSNVSAESLPNPTTSAARESHV